MARYHRAHRGPGWHQQAVISLAGASTPASRADLRDREVHRGRLARRVVFPLLVFAADQAEPAVPDGAGGAGEDRQPRGATGAPTAPTYSRRTVFVFVDDYDLATLAGLRYARSLRPTSLRAVHFVLDNVQAAKLRQDWVRGNTGWCSTLVDCPDRRLAKAAAEMVLAEANAARRRSDRGLAPAQLHAAARPAAARPHRRQDRERGQPDPARRGHDRAVRRRSRVESMIGQGPRAPERDDRRSGATGSGTPAEPASGSASGARVEAADRAELGTAAMAGQQDTAKYNRPAPSAGATPIGQLPKRGRATVEGRVHAVEIRPVERNTVLACEIVDSTGQLTAMFYGRSYIPGFDPGAKVRLTGPVGSHGREVVMINPAYELLAPGSRVTAAMIEPDRRTWMDRGAVSCPSPLPAPGTIMTWTFARFPAHADRGASQFPDHRAVHHAVGRGRRGDRGLGQRRAGAVRGRRSYGGRRGRDRAVPAGGRVREPRRRPRSGLLVTPGPRSSPRWRTRWCCSPCRYSSSPSRSTG